MNAATKNAIGNELARLLNTSQQRDDEDGSRLTIKDVFAVYRDKSCSIKGAPIGRLVDENMRTEHAMYYWPVGRVNPTILMYRLLRLGRR